MKKIAIYGAGGFGREVFCMIKKINEKNPIWDVIGFFDDGITKGSFNNYGTILGNIDDLNSWNDEIGIVMAIGDGAITKKIVSKVINPKVYYPNIEYYLWTADRDSLEIGVGNIIAGGCSFSCDVKVGNFNIFNGSVVLGHDVTIGDFNVFMPAVRISGDVKINNDNFFGISSIVLQSITVGDCIRLGAGSVLMTKPKVGNLYIGNPAKIFKFKP